MPLIADRGGQSRGNAAKPVLTVCCVYVWVGGGSEMTTEDFFWGLQVHIKDYLH